MNLPPEESIRVAPEKLRGFVAAAAGRVGLPEEKAELLAELLTGNDLRGVFSHGTQQVATYARLMRDGRLNPAPEIRVVRETPCSLLVDGDGGLGYFPAHEGTRLLIDKALQVGMAAMMSRNHGHFGAAGIYARMPLERDLITFVTSGHQLHLKPGAPLYDAAGGSPMAFSAPAGEQSSLVLDFGAMHDLYPGSRRDEVARLAPGLVLRCIGMGEVCQAWGGLLSGLPLRGEPPRWQWPGANQGSLVICLRIDLFTEPAVFRQEMDVYARAVGQLQPLEGFAESYMAGGVEAARETESRRDGVPVGPHHRERFEELAGELDLELPW